MEQKNSHLHQGGLLYHGYAATIQAIVTLVWHPSQQHSQKQLEHRKKDSHGQTTTTYLSLPDDIQSIDSGLLDDSGLPVLAGLTGEYAGVVLGLDLSGHVLWRYPDAEEGAEEDSQNHHRFYSLAWANRAVDKSKQAQDNKRPDNDVSEDNRQRLFLAGSRNNRPRLWVMDLNNNQVVQRISLKPPQASGMENLSGHYQQVINFSESNILALAYHDEKAPQYRLDKWFYSPQQWLYNVLSNAFALSYSPSENITSAMLKLHSSDSFFLVTSSSDRLRMSLLGAESGDQLDTLSLSIGSSQTLSWEGISIINTPAFLSKRSAITQTQETLSAADSQQAYVENLVRIINDLSKVPRLVAVNRGGLLGISGQNTRSQPLVVDLHKDAFSSAGDHSQEQSYSTSLGESPLSDWIYKKLNSLTGVPTGPQTYWLLLAQVALTVAYFSRNQLLRVGNACYHRLYQGLLGKPKNSLKLEDLRQKRIERLHQDEPPVSLNMRMGNHRFFSDMPDSSGVSAVSSFPVPEKTEQKSMKNPRHFSQQLKEHLDSAIKSQKKHSEKNNDQFRDALLKVLMRREAQRLADQQASLPRGLVLKPMPADQYCFYHCIGQTLGVGGPSFFQALSQTAQGMLQDAPEFAALINHFDGGEGAVEELAAMGHVQAANQGRVDQQIWGHIGLLPFICWYLGLSIVVVTPGTWHSGSGALYFMPDGHWELMGESSDEITQTLLSLHQDNPQLLIMQHDGFSHWDVVEVEGKATGGR